MSSRALTPSAVLPLLALVAACAGPGKGEPVAETGGADTGCEPWERAPQYLDSDGDGYGQAGSSALLCPDAEGYAETGDDCDDANGAVHPGSPESCDVVDEDCDGVVDDGFETGLIYRDWDGDGYGDPEEPAEGCLSATGWTTDASDCNDYQATAYPGAEELCNAEDDDCDGEEDEGLETATVYLDQDDDGYGDPAYTQTGCEDGYVWSSAGGDCLDSDRDTNPGEEEGCEDGWDRDCDGLVDCEDEDCADASVCGEGDCTDGRDQDDDGYTDCHDDECWGVEGCPGVMVTRVIAGGSAFLSEESVHWSVRDTCSETLISASHHTEVRRHYARGVQGVALRYAAGAESAARCDWGLDLAGIGGGSWRVRWSVSSTDRWTTSFSQRSGFWISGDCGLDSSGFLPPLSDLQERWTLWYEGNWSGSGGWGTDDIVKSYPDCLNLRSWDWDYESYAVRMAPGTLDAWTTSAYERIR